jgi:hypothetical protein
MNAANKIVIKFKFVSSKTNIPIIIKTTVPIEENNPEDNMPVLPEGRPRAVSLVIQ